MTENQELNAITQNETQEEFISPFGSGIDFSKRKIYECFPDYDEASYAEFLEYNGVNREYVSEEDLGD